MDYAVASLISAAALAGYLTLFHLYTRATRRLESAEATLAVEASGLRELIAENIEMGQRLDKLREAEIGFYQLRREHARTNSMLQHLARVEAGLRLEIARLHERHMSAKA
jgi:Tfp pilus assembly protein PilN